MKLTEDDKRILKEFGHKEKDFSQIARAADKSITTYKYSEGQGYSPITREQAIELLGKRKWLAGISRSAFHWNTVQIVDDNNGFKNVFFDSSKLFE